MCVYYTRNTPCTNDASEELEESSEYESNCQLLVTPFSYVVGTQLRHEDFYAIQQLIAKTRVCSSYPLLNG